MENKVKEYIEKQNPKEKDLLKKSRALIIKTIPGCDEFVEYGVLCFSKGKIYLTALKGRIHVGF